MFGGKIWFPIPRPTVKLVSPVKEVNWAIRSPMGYWIHWQSHLNLGNQSVWIFGPLPLSSNWDGNFDSIMVIICLLTAMVELIPSRINYRVQDLAELMFEHVYKHHGLPKTIVSDHDVLFTSTFWGHLNALIGIKLKMSSAYHLQTDGTDEHRAIAYM